MGVQEEKGRNEIDYTMDRSLAQVKESRAVL